MKGVKHYLKNGTEFKGKTHKMKDGALHTGATHTASSKKLFHFKVPFFRLALLKYLRHHFVLIHL